jgi:hypothetical protein
MAKVTVNFSCGHSEVQQFYGKHAERVSRLEWLERGVCRECFRVEQIKKRAGESTAAAEQAKNNGLPPLVGSEKQIAWAETIRKNALISESNTVISRGKYEEEYAKLSSEEQKNKAVRIFESMVRARNRLETETSSKWWIDNRDTIERYVREQGIEASKKIAA